MRILHQLHIKGFKSIRDQKLVFNPLNVFIGSNGSGKSNLVGAFHLLNRVSNQQLQVYTGESGGANTILHFGRKHTEKLYFEIEFRLGTKANFYEFELKPTDEDRFIFLMKQLISRIRSNTQSLTRTKHGQAMLKLAWPSRRNTSQSISENIWTVTAFIISTTRAPLQG